MVRRRPSSKSTCARQPSIDAIFSDEATSLIHASVTLSETGSADPVTLRSFLGDSLPAYAVPISLTIREDFPRTTSGKIDRIKLAAETQGFVPTLERA